MVLGFSLPFFLNFYRTQPKSILSSARSANWFWLVSPGRQPQEIRCPSVSTPPRSAFAQRGGPTGWALRVGVMRVGQRGGRCGWALPVAGFLPSFLLLFFWAAADRPAPRHVSSRAVSLSSASPGAMGARTPKAKHHNLHLPFLPLLISFRAHAVPLFSFPHGTVNDAPHAGYPTAADDWMASVIVSRILISKFPKLH